jgi:hypothetical protein
MYKCVPENDSSAKKKGCTSKSNKMNSKTAVITLNFIIILYLVLSFIEIIKKFRN